jgi:anti-sigma regulatory factor (Ser/Thr protein kinase)
VKTWRRDFHGGPAAARSARRAVCHELRGEIADERLSDVELLVSELATNCIRHGAADEEGELVVEAAVTAECVRLRLCDHGAGFERRQPRPRPDGAGGYGLVLLDRLSDRWGVQRDGAFCVWFEIQRA